MYYCPNCMSEVKPGTSFCTQCGTKLDNVIEDVEETEYYEEYYEDTPIYRGISRGERKEILNEIDAGYGIFSLSVKGIILLVAVIAYAFLISENSMRTFNAFISHHIFLSPLFIIIIAIFLTGYIVCEIWYFSRFRDEMGYKICPFYFYFLLIPFAGLSVMVSVHDFMPLFILSTIAVTFIVLYLLSLLRTGHNGVSLNVALFGCIVMAFIPFAAIGIIIILVIAAGIVFLVFSGISKTENDYIHNRISYYEYQEQQKLDEGAMEFVLFVGPEMFVEYLFPWKRAHRVYGELKRKIAIYKQNYAEA